ncbi:alkylphosphonate utilization protein PhnH [Pseudooceanicola batsensis HTCC2597]|uniref:Alkylphosphonate utilization protein PhnH n=1 Tax=Pseudooceanicola batsensis (strain ATCC BAA-863 / DSM 15984 / KCTC 12145 / HTCC2597) TaxID=252305 RepID=A3TSU9_PSEBH|nr:phosphonate C-P lyase system protein PhnH [Pseudooceanicola batsensis]EAQ04726.1 alkylphosphonate utilization protein PhnH [Pseudooceanicola batsensis HTCC2597]
MAADALEGGFAEAPIQSAQAFRAAMECMARPGRIDEIAGGAGPAPLSVAASTLLLTLCDPETPVHLAGAFDRAELREWITFHAGAPLVEAGEALFAVGHWDELMPLDRFRVGTPEYPDRSATLIVELDGLEPAGAMLRGPGIRETAALSLPERAAFVANRQLFPLGLDFFFTCGTRLAALPRTTEVS